MLDVEPMSIEPFVDRVSGSQLTAGRNCVRIGYRIEGHDDVLAAVDIPIRLLEQEITSRLEVVATLALSGDVIAHVVDSSGSPLPGPRSITSMDQLVSQAVSADTVRLEEASPSELSGLLTALESAIIRVRAALAQIYVEG